MFGDVRKFVIVCPRFGLFTAPHFHNTLYIFFFFCNNLMRIQLYLLYLVLLAEWINLLIRAQICAVSFQVRFTGIETFSNISWYLMHVIHLA